MCWKGRSILTLVFCVVVSQMAATGAAANSDRANIEKGTHRRHTQAARRFSISCPSMEIPLLPLPVGQPPVCESSDTFYASPLFCHYSAKPLLVIIILSYIGNFESRHQARTTWLRSRFKMSSEFVDSHPWAYAFVVGRARGDGAVNMEKLAAIEGCHYRDIMYVDVIESYYNLTWKKLEAWKYVKSNFDFEVMLKADDDSIINIQLVFEWLDEAIPIAYDKCRTNSSLRVMYGGLCRIKDIPVRNQSNKWYLSYEDFTPNVFPPTCVGAGYFVSRDLMTALLEIPDLMYSFRIEDVHTGLLVAKTGLVPAAHLMHTTRVCNHDIPSCSNTECRQPYILMTKKAARRAELYKNFMRTKC